MLVKVCDTYMGTFGRYNSEIGMVEAKTRESEPFEIDSDVAERLMEKGVLEAVKGAAKAEKIEAKPEKAEAPKTEKTWNEVRAEAKKLGLNITGKKRPEVEAMIEEALSEDEDAPVFDAEAPV